MGETKRRQRCIGSVHERQGGGGARWQRWPGRVAVVLYCEEGGDGDSWAEVGQKSEWAGRADGPFQNLKMKIIIQNRLGCLEFWA
jgi:hypothetical protein